MSSPPKIWVEGLREINATCGNCKFSAYGECRRHSPAFVDKSLNPINKAWPGISSFDWCGDFEISEGARKEVLDEFNPKS